MGQHLHTYIAQKSLYLCMDESNFVEVVYNEMQQLVLQKT